MIGFAAQTLSTPIPFFLELPVDELIDWLETASLMPRIS
jgi:hypothetical protein